ncbi:hypothetical protein R3P38DRAFT_3228740 [Favolaschia claudopus]|uniref:Uncharacterized protein n=1 Tax=Favolaschia claudopus TaxID=2862362 RepID=A0AAV9ZQ55_9AGAR
MAPLFRHVTFSLSHSPTSSHLHLIKPLRSSQASQLKYALQRPRSCMDLAAWSIFCRGVVASHPMLANHILILVNEIPRAIPCDAVLSSASGSGLGWLVRCLCPLILWYVEALVGGRHNVQLGPPWEPGAYWVNANRFLDVQMSSAGGRPTFDGLSSELDQSAELLQNGGVE